MSTIDPLGQLIEWAENKLCDWLDTLSRWQYHRLCRQAVAAYAVKKRRTEAEEREFLAWQEQHRERLVRNNARRWN